MRIAQGQRDELQGMLSTHQICNERLIKQLQTEKAEGWNECAKAWSVWVALKFCPSGLYMPKAPPNPYMMDSQVD